MISIKGLNFKLKCFYSQEILFSHMNIHVIFKTPVIGIFNVFYCSLEDHPHKRHANNYSRSMGSVSL